tara:strand:- start:55 stop:216 length:162 start_codon:yes stop_codon:yes gene_type:complete
MDYTNADLNINVAKNDDYYEVPDEDYHTETFVQPESETDDYEEILPSTENKEG